jgi:hypothetical protein
MVDILHRIGVVAPLDDVYQAVATPEGIERSSSCTTAAPSGRRSR